MKKIDSLILLVILAIIINSFLLGARWESVPNFNLITGNIIKADVNLGKDGVGGSIESRGPYCFSENFLIICFGILILAIACKIITTKFLWNKNDK